jgi:hypothetical protein
MSNLPEPAHRRLPALHPSYLRAAVSPTAVALTAAGAGIGVLDHSPLLAVILAGVGWAGRMAAAVVTRVHRDRAARPRPARLDPWSVPEPWRSLVQQAADTQTRFNQTVADWPAGPTKDRLVELQPRVWDQVQQLGILAHRGAAADGWTGAGYSSGRPTTDRLGEELKEVQAERARRGPAVVDLERREAAVAAELRARRHQEEASAAIRDQLRTAVARFDQTVADLLAVEPTGDGRPLDAGGVTSALDELSDGLSSLRAALTETTGTQPGAGNP